MKKKTISIALILAALLVAPLAADARKFMQCVGGSSLNYVYSDFDGRLMYTYWMEYDPDCYD